MEYIIGIDLGTTNSCVGVWKNNKVDIIPVPETGDKITPSIVCFNNNEEIVGILSKNKSEQYYKSIIYDSKRLIGKKYHEIDKKELEVYPFEIEPDKENNIKIVIKVNEETKKFSPEEISSKILKKLKKDAEVYLGKEVEKAIVTVPANFTEKQRKSTIKAAELAGLNVVKTINEPTAAAVAYSFENKSEKERIICVFDFGGGTLDITILKNQGMKLNIICTLGDPHLGGQDIDNLLVHHFVQKLKDENNINVSNNNKELMKLKNKCEDLKKDLSIRKETSIDYYFKNQEIFIEMLRSEFDVLCKDLFSRCINLLNECVKSSGLKKNEIEEVVLVGGSSRIPKIQEMIKEYFNNKINLSKSINPEEAVAYGAAFTAYKFNQKKKKQDNNNEINNKNNNINENNNNNEINNKNNNINENNNDNDNDDFKISDVIPFSLGVKIEGDLMDKIINKNSRIPIKVEKEYETTEKYQKQIRIQIYEGENKYANKNSFLSEFIFPLTPHKKNYINVIFEIDEKYSTLIVSAEEINGKKKKQIKVEVNTNINEKNTTNKNNNNKNSLNDSFDKAINQKPNNRRKKKSSINCICCIC